jgi:hypothetical protein
MIDQEKDVAGGDGVKSGRWFCDSSGEPFLEPPPSVELSGLAGSFGPLSAFSASWYGSIAVFSTFEAGRGSTLRESAE